ncbi:MAG: hypothetical protein EA402_01165, partial [Planctomycetota bacterium]
MQSQRYVNLACQQGYLAPHDFKLAQERHRQDQAAGRVHSLWEVIQELGYISKEQAAEVESAMDAAQAGEGLEIESYRLVDSIGYGGMGEVYHV